MAPGLLFASPSHYPLNYYSGQKPVLGLKSKKMLSYTVAANLM